MKCLTASDSEEKARYCEILNACVAEQSSVAVSTNRDNCSNIGMEYDPEIDRYKEAGNSICVYKGEGSGTLGNFYEASEEDMTHATGNQGLCTDDSYVLRTNTGNGTAYDHFSCIPCSNSENNNRVWDGNRCVDPDTSNIQDIGPANLESSYDLQGNFGNSSHTNTDPMVFYKKREDPSSASLPEGQGFFKDTIQVTSCNSIPTDETIVNAPASISSCKTSTEKCTFDVDSELTSPGYIGTLNGANYNTIEQCRACNVPTTAQEVDGKNHTRLVNSSGDPAEEVIVTEGGNSTCRRICGPNTTPLGINAGLLSNIYGGSIDTVPRVTGSGGQAEGTEFSVYCGTGENAGCGVGQKMIGPSTSTDLSQPLFRCETEDLNERIELATLAGMINIRGAEGSILGTDVNNAYGVYSCTGLGLKEKDPPFGGTIDRANQNTFQEFYSASHENTVTPAPPDDLLAEGYMCDKYTDCNDYTTNHGCNDGKVPNEANANSAITYATQDQDALFNTSSAASLNAGEVDADTGNVKQLLIDEKARVNTYLQSQCCRDA